MSIDERFIKALHVEILREQDLQPEDKPHVIFQTSTIDALLDGAYDGDVTFGELRKHGDFGLGTLDAVDGEMIALDGRFYRVAGDGTVGEVPDSARTPFAVVTRFEPDATVTLQDPLDHHALLERVETALPDGPCQALRIDGRFDFVVARSVHRQTKPYPPLAEVAAHQSVFTLRDVQGTLVGFRFPDYAKGLEVPGYHLHFITDDRTRGGHVLDCRLNRGTLALEGSTELHLELPPGIDLLAPDARGGKRELLDRIEGRS
ncbi:MAG: acetolactate decarboxylase [Thermoleophilaceae bacterium]|jgi:acetolactate decarboxylase